MHDSIVQYELCSAATWVMDLFAYVHQGIDLLTALCMKELMHTHRDNDYLSLL